MQVSEIDPESKALTRIIRLTVAVASAVFAVLIPRTGIGAPGATDSIPAALFASGSTQAADTRIDDSLRAAARKDLFSGVVLLARGEKVLFQGAYGMASREYGVHMALDTRLNLASASKMFTTVAIGTLIDQGKVRLDDAVAKYLDASWIKPKTAGNITVANLLSHTSGLPDYFGPEFFDRSRTLFKKLADYKPLVANMDPLFAPGSQWQYSNTNFLLLGAIIENAAGTSYDEYVQHAVFSKAGMTGTGALDLEQVNHDYAQGYAKSPPPPPPPGGPTARQDFREITSAMAAAQEQLAKTGFEWRNNIFMHVVKGESSGGAFSTASDLLRFANALTSGRLIKTETLEKLTTKSPQSPDYAYGFQLLDGGFGHTGGFPGINTAVIMYPDGYRLIVLSNVDGGSAVANNALLRLGASTN